MTLFLIPNLLHDSADPKASLVPAIGDAIYDLDGFIVETPKLARKYLKHFDFDRLRDLPMEYMGKKADNIEDVLERLQKGEKWGVISDAGLPCIADPGSQIVSQARRLGIPVVAFPGPCSITHALSLSGFDGNGFTFHGYFPKKPNPDLFKIKGIHIFIETPYNNNATIKKILAEIKQRDLLCVACDLMAPDEQVIVQKAAAWLENKDGIDFHKKPAMLLVQVR